MKQGIESRTVMGAGARTGVTRRGFLAGAGAAALGALGLAAAGAPLAGLGGSGRALADAGEAAETVTVTDMAGREVTFPKNPAKVFSSSPAAEAWLVALVPERLIGWANKMSEAQLSYYPESVREAPLVGGWYGYTEGNAEGIITMAPDVVISAPRMYDEASTADAVTSAEELSVKLGTPVLVVNAAMDSIAEVYRVLGEWLGVPERGEELAAYVQGEMDKVKAAVESVPEDEVATYYYAEDVSGLMSEGDGSQHIGVFDFCEMVNAAQLEVSSFMGREEVSMEQVIQWDPETIFAFTKQAYNTILTDPAWADIRAVKDGKVFICPSMPQNWYDRSPNPLRCLGCLYTASVVYPDYVDYDLREEVGDYFRTLYGVDITDEQYEALFDTTVPAQS